MEILRVYVLGPNLHRLLQRFWGDHTVVLRAGTLFGKPVGTGRGVNQRDPISPTIFNTLVDSVVSVVLS